METPPANPTEVTQIIWNAIEEQGLDGEHFFGHFSPSLISKIYWLLQLFDLP